MRFLNIKYFLCLLLTTCFLEGTEKLDIIHSSDAGADDFVASCVLTLDPNANLKSVIITNADCVPEYALSAYGKFMCLFEREIPFGLSQSRPWNQFPWLWKEDTIRVNDFACLTPYASIQQELTFNGDRILLEQLENAEENQIHLVATGPLTTLSDILKAHPHLKGKIRSLHWMGGAIDVRGNLIDAEIDARAINERAEWNAFADAFAVDWIFRNTAFPIYLIPLDITNENKITAEFLEALSRNSLEGSYPSQFVLEAYKPLYEMGLEYMWDVVTAAALLHPELFEPPMPTYLRVATGACDHGALIRDDNGREVNVFFQFKGNNPAYFREFLLRLLRGQEFALR